MFSFQRAILMLLAVSASSAQFIDYSPCTTALNDKYYIINCQSNTAQEILTTFQRAPPNDLIAALTILDIEGMTDDIMSQILDTVVSVPSNSLNVLHLKNNSLTKIPDQVRDLTELTTLLVYNNPLNVLPAGSLALKSKLNQLVLADSYIRTIEPGAFVGDFSSTQLALQGNILDSFDEAVFLELLQSMETSTGYVQLAGVFSMACDCTLAWLIRDNPQLLHLAPGQCGYPPNSIPWNGLTPEDFADCP